MKEPPTMLRISKELRHQLRIHAVVRGVTQQTLLEKIVSDWLEEQSTIQRHLELVRR